MKVDPEFDVEYQGISTDSERYIFDYLFSAKCSNPLDIVSNSNFIKFCNFRTGKPQCEDFRHERNGHVYFFVPSLLSLLDKGTITMDGTWSIVKHLPYIQLYIISQYLRIGDRCFTMPIIYVMMPSRKTKDYNILFSDIQFFYKKYCARDLGDTLTKIQVDAEIAAVNSIIENFPNASLLLCRTHLVRQWLRWFKYFMGGYFFQNSFLLGIWKFVLGITFLDLSNREIRNNVFTIFEKFYASDEMKGFKKKFKRFISYICKNYLNETCRFPHSWWNYHEALSGGDFCLTTNSLENLNGKLKTKVGVGYLSRAKAYKKLLI